MLRASTRKIENYEEGREKTAVSAAEKRVMAKQIGEIIKGLDEAIAMYDRRIAELDRSNRTPAEEREELEYLQMRDEYILDKQGLQISLESLADEETEVRPVS